MVWYFMLFLLAGSAPAAGKPLVLVEAPVLTVDQNGQAEAIIVLRNNMLRNDPNAEIRPLRLNLADFTHTRPDGKSYPLGTTRTLVAVSDSEKLIFNGEAPLSDAATLSVRVTVTNLWEAGQSEAILKDGDRNIPVLSGLPESRLKAIRIPAAYNVQIIPPTSNTPEIHFVGDRALVGLKNSDPFTYRLAWKLHLNGQLFEGGKNFIDLPPGASKYVYLERPTPDADFPQPSWLTAGTLKDEIVQGNLILEPVFGGDAMIQPLPPKDLPVMFRLSYSSGNWQQFWNVFWIFLLLVVGGVFSIWVHAGMPNTARALALRRRLDDLETKIHGLGVSIDSRWRVLLESHLPAIRRELFSTFWAFPSFATTLDGLTKKVDMVQQWAEVAYSASVVLYQVNQSMQLIPHTVLLWIRERCARALTPIESGLTTDAEIEAMKANISAAQNYLTVTLARTQNPELDKEITDRENRLQDQDKEITDRENRLQANLDRLGTSYTQCTGLVNQVKDAINSHIPPSPVNYSARDVGSLKVDLLWTYDQRRQQISGDTVAFARLETYRPRLMEYLVADTHESLRIARLIVDEMRQDIYPDALKDALKSEVSPPPPALTITTDPAAVHAQSPVRLALRFNRPLLNEAVARQEWTCTWDFGDNTPHADGWEVFHSYELPGKQEVRVMIYDLDGKPVIILAPIPGTVIVGDGPERSVPTRGVQPQPQTWPEYVRHVLVRFLRFVKLEPETRLELVQLGIALTLALLGLMTIARQQAQNLSFLEAVGAVVALGFGIDTIKSLIMQRSSSS